MTDVFGEARTAEKKGALRKAAHLYAEAGFDWITESKFNPDTKYRLGVAALIAAISCACRADDDQHAVGVAKTAQALLDHALNQDSEQDLNLNGIYQEWKGDIEFMIEGGQANEYYARALGSYSDASPETRLSWAMEQEFDYERNAFNHYLKSCEYLDEDEELPHMDFKKRVECKISLI